MNDGGPSAGVVSLSRLLDLDDVGAGIGQSRGIRPGEDPRQIDDADPCDDSSPPRVSCLVALQAVESPSRTMTSAVLDVYFSCRYTKPSEVEAMEIEGADVDVQRTTARAQPTTWG